MNQTFENMNTEEFITHMGWVIDQIDSDNQAFLDVIKESIRRLETLVSIRHRYES